MSWETERLLEIAGDVGQRLNHALRDAIPPEAQQHLLNAQRELLSALFLIYEHQAAARRSAPTPVPSRRQPAVQPPSPGAASSRNASSRSASQRDATSPDASGGDAAPGRGAGAPASRRSRLNRIPID